MISCLRFNKLITPKTIESGLWALQAPRQLLNIANIQSRSWSGGIWASGKTPLVFVEEGVKINQKVQQMDILEAVVLSCAQKHFGNANWTFQQDSAPAHKVKKTQEWCKVNFPDTISSEECPPPLHAGSQSQRLQCMVHFRVQGLHETAQNFELSRKIASAEMG
ncbi:DDE_3 domain-containing protein [Trichonephila clavipes]|nr:DDE_3 domain-containing protein [Trichonephila clavipes]